MPSIVYKNNLIIGNQKKFQRFTHDTVSPVLYFRDYFLYCKLSAVTFLMPNTITDTADFHGKLCYVKTQKILQPILQAVGIVLWILGSQALTAGVLSFFNTKVINELFVVSIFLFGFI